MATYQSPRFSIGADERGNEIEYALLSDGWYNLYTETGPYTAEQMAVWFGEKYPEIFSEVLA